MKARPIHSDDTGWIYFVPLVGRPSIIYTDDAEVLARNGDVCRLYDYAVHSTCDESARVCLFVGPYEEPADAAANAALNDGLQRLERGLYDAPRVRDGFRVVMRDECYALVDDYPELMLTKDAKERGLTIALCAHCARRAVKLDRNFPWYVDDNVCEVHRKKEAA